MKKIMQLKEVIVWFTSTSNMFSVRVCVCVCVCMCVRAQLCLSLCDPLDYSLPGSSVRGIFPAKILECVAVSYSRVAIPCLNANLIQKYYFL